MIVGRNSSVPPRDGREKNVLSYGGRTWIYRLLSSAKCVCPFVAASAAQMWRQRASGRRIYVDSSDGYADLSRRLLRVVEWNDGTTVRAALKHVTRGACRLPMLGAIKTVVTLYDRIILTARAFIQPYRILTIGNSRKPGPR